MSETSYSLRKNRVHFRKRLTTLNIKKILLLINFIISFTKCQRNIYLRYSHLTLKINQIGENRILGDFSKCSDGAQFPDIIQINNVNQSQIREVYDLNESENIIRLIWYKDPKSTACLFRNCSNITEIDLSNFNSSNITYFQLMFELCTSLTSILLSNFNNSKINQMNFTFSDCSSLKTFYQKYYDSNIIINNYQSTGGYYFDEVDSFYKLCYSSCKSCNIGGNDINHNCIECKDDYIFEMNISIYKNCYLNCSNYHYYDKINNKSYCTPDLKCSGIYNKLIPDKYECIDNCYKDIEYKYEYKSKCYKECPINTHNNKNKCIPYIENKIRMLNDQIIPSDTDDRTYEELWFINVTSNTLISDHSKIEEIQYTNQFIESDNKDKTEKIYVGATIDETTQENIIFDSIKSTDTYQTKITASFIKEETGKIVKDSSLGESQDSIFIDNIETTNYYQNEIRENSNTIKLDYSSNIPTFIKQSNSEIINEYKLTENSLNTDEIQIESIKGSDESNSIFPIETQENSHKIKELELTNSVFNDENEYQSQNQSSYTNDIKYDLNYSDSERSQNYEMSSTILNIENYEAYLTQNTIFEENITEIINKSKLINNIIKNLINNLNTSNMGFKEDLEIEVDNILIILTTTDNQKYNENNNKTSINFGECENKLKSVYNIPKNDSLYIIKIDIKEEGMKIPKVEYEVYYPLYDDNLMQLNLLVCEGSKIEISIPVSIEDDLEKYNKSSDYYNDICSLSKSEYGVDISLYDRKNEFIDNNMTLCEENCDLKEYNYDTQKAKCSCDVKIDLPLIESIQFDKKALSENFSDKKNPLNLKILKCYKNVFRKNNLKKNIGFFVILTVIIFYFFCLFKFGCESFYLLKNKIRNIIVSAKFKKEDKKSHKTDKNSDLVIFLQLKENKIIQVKNPGRINKDDLNIKNNNEMHHEKTIMNKESDKHDKDNIKTEKKVKYKEFELNHLNYKDALKYDKRNYFEYYISLLKSNHLIIFSFCNSIDNNSKIIKIFYFFFCFTTYYAINVLFFSDSVFHKLYKDKGEYNFNFFIPKIIYSCLIADIINALVKLLSLSQKNIMDIKQEKNIDNLEKKGRQIMRIITFKFVYFFIVTFLFLNIFWYYITCFCGIYINSQIILIKNTLISFTLSFIYPFVKCLIPGIFRLCALSSKTENRQYLYQSSLVIKALLLIF